MPFNIDTLRLSPEQDRRRKLTEEQKTEIKELYNSGGYSLNKLAVKFGVSKKLILLIVNPESKRKNDEYIYQHWREFK